MTYHPHAKDPVFYVRAIPIGTKIPIVIEFGDRLLSWSYEDDEKQADKLTLQVDNYDLTYFDAPYLMKGSRLLVKWGYPGNLSPERECVIKSSVGLTTINVEAYDTSILMHSKNKMRQFENMTRSEVVRQIAVENGFDFEVQYIAETSQRFEQITQANVSDAQFIRQLATKEGFVFYVDFDGLHFHKRILKNKPICEFVYHLEGGNNDVISVTLENDLFGGGKKGGVVVEGRDPLKKTPIKAEANNSTHKDDSLAPVVEIFTAISEKDGTETRSMADAGSVQSVPTTASTEAEAKTQAAAIYAGWKLGTVELSLEAIGNPQLVAKSIVRVSGIGSMLSGNYYLSKIAHKGGSDYRMSLKLKRDGKSEIVKDDSNVVGGVVANSNVNDQKPSGSSSSSNSDSTLTYKVDERTGVITPVDTNGRDL